MMQNKPTSLVRAARRDLSRLRKVSATIVKQGFGELLLKTPLGRRLFARGDLPSAEGAVEGSAAVRFTRTRAALDVETSLKLAIRFTRMNEVLMTSAESDISGGVAGEVKSKSEK